MNGRRHPLRDVRAPRTKPGVRACASFPFEPLARWNIRILSTLGILGLLLAPTGAVEATGNPALGGVVLVVLAYSMGWVMLTRMELTTGDILRWKVACVAVRCR